MSHVEFFGKAQVNMKNKQITGSRVSLVAELLCTHLALCGMEGGPFGFSVPCGEHWPMAGLQGGQTLPSRSSRV
jgi:hypothetical protein